MIAATHSEEALKDSGDRKSASSPPDASTQQEKWPKVETIHTLGQWPMVWPTDERTGRKVTRRSKGLRAGIENGDGHMRECTKPKTSASHIVSEAARSVVSYSLPPRGL